MTKSKVEKKIGGLLPTLLKKGFIEPSKSHTKKDKELLKNTISIDYIMNFISDRTIDISGKIKIEPKGIGDKVIVLKSGTGTGKSTVLPPTLYKLFNERTKSNIAVTQPRVLTAIDIPTGLPEFYTFLEMGKNLGYNTGSYKRTPIDKGIIYMTTGILLQQMNVMTEADFMKKYSFILIDEVHDRDLNIDITLYLLKKFLQINYKNPKCPIIILMSATFKQETFIEYFECPINNAITVTGATFPIDDNFLKYDTTDYIKKVINIAEEIHIKNISDILENSLYRDIIIFINGASPAKQIIESLHKFNSTVLTKTIDEINKYIDDKPPDDRIGGNSQSVKFSNYYIAPIDLSSGSFGLAGIEYQKLFSAIENIKIPIYNLTTRGDIDINSIKEYVIPTRRIIISTPVAETGVTIDTLKYCIDTGLVTSVEFNPDYGTQLILKKPVTKGMAMQRRGRVGRKSPGVWYACYTKECFDKLQDDQFAEILSTDITLTLLNIIIKETETHLKANNFTKLNEKYITDKKIFKTNDIEINQYYYIEHYKSLNTASIDFLENPSAQSLAYSYEKLYGLGFIDINYQPTAIGFYGNKLRKISIEDIKFILSGYCFGANILDLITIVSFLSVNLMNICERKYKPINPFSKVSDENYDFYHRIVIGDSFIDLLFIWYLFSEEIGRGINKNISEHKIEEWCKLYKLKYTGILQVIAFRDDLIESFISIGLNPYYNGLNISQYDYNLLHIFRGSLSDGVDEITKIKKCIYEGYKFNLCVWNNNLKRYILQHKNVPIFVKSNVIHRMGDDAVQTNPNFIILSNIMFKQSFMDENIYEFTSTGCVSIMDTYVNVDLNFFTM
jgi:HrpA-like RNA helicase